MNIRKTPKFMCAQAYTIGGFLSRELSAEIGDEFDLKRHISYRELRFLITFQPFLLAKNDKFAQKESDMFQSRFFAVFRGG